MDTYGARLPQLDPSVVYLMDGGLETAMIFHEGLGLLREGMPQLSVLGGCCGTDARHVTAIAAAVAR